MKPTKKTIISATFWKLLDRGGNAAAQLIVQIVMARLLAPEQFGALAIMLVFVNLGNVIVQSGLNTALIQAPAVSDEDYSTVFWMSFVISVMLFACVFVCAPWIAEFYRMPEIVWPLRGMAFIFIVNSLNSVQIAKVTRDLQMRKIFYSTLASVTISGAVGISSAYAGAGLWSLVFQQVTYQAINCISLNLQVDWKPSLSFNWTRARKLFEFGWRLLISGLIDQGYQSLADLIIGKQFSARSLGLVSQGKKYPNAVGTLLDGSIQPVMLSAISRTQSDPSAAKRLVRRALKTSTYLIVPAMTLFACVAPTIVPMLLGEQWTECVPFLQLYCLIYALLPIHTTNLQALNGMGRSDIFLKLELVKKTYGVAALLFCAFVLRDVGLLVASYLVTGIISTFVNALPNKRIIGYSYSEQLRDIAPAFILSAVASAPTIAINAFGIHGLSGFILQILVFIFTYIACSILIGLEEFNYLKTTVRELLGSK